MFSLFILLIVSLDPSTVLSSPLPPCVVPGTVKVPLYSSSCADLPANSDHASLVMTTGESEHFQVILPANIQQASVTASIFLAAKSSAQCSEALNFELYRVGYVYCDSTWRYGGSGGGWHPDPLFPLSFGIPFDVLGGPLKDFVDPHQYPVTEGQEVIEVQPLWVRVTSAADFSPPASGLSCSYELSLLVSQGGTASDVVSVAVLVKLLPVAMPSSHDALYKVIMAFEYDRESGSPEELSNHYYPSTQQNNTMSDETLHEWLTFTASRRMPGDTIYDTHPRSVQDLLFIAETGATQLGLMYVSSGGDQCNNFSPEYISELLQTLEPTVAGLEAADAFGRGTDYYIYGFDEASPHCEAGIRLLYGAVKKAFPALKTFAVLNWDYYPPDLPVDNLVQQYEEYNEELVNSWLTVPSRSYWQYWCIEPCGGDYLNTFIERPGVRTRLLFWLSSQQAQGMLYYASDLWRGGPYGPKPFITTLSSTSLSTWPVANWIWFPRTDLFANGDGQFMYPGEAGPVGSIRYDNIQDGLEDAQIWKMLGDRASKYVPTIVTGPTSYIENDSLLQMIRSEALFELSGMTSMEPVPGVGSR